MGFWEDGVVRGWRWMYRSGAWAQTSPFRSIGVYVPNSDPKYRLWVQLSVSESMSEYRVRGPGGVFGGIAGHIWKGMRL